MESKILGRFDSRQSKTFKRGLIGPFFCASLRYSDQDIGRTQSHSQECLPMRPCSSSSCVFPPGAAEEVYRQMMQANKPIAHVGCCGSAS